MVGGDFASMVPLLLELGAAALGASRLEGVVIAAHGNVTGGLVTYRDDVSESDIVELNTPTGQPRVYELDDELKPLRHYYLGDTAAIKAAMEAVANQGKAR